MGVFGTIAPSLLICFNEATAERQKYEKILDSLETRLVRLNKLDELIIHTAMEYDIMESCPESAQGHLNDIYYEKESINRQEVLSELSEIAGVRDEICRQKETVRAVYEELVQEEQRIWQQMAEEQAAREKAEEQSW